MTTDMAQFFGGAKSVTSTSDVDIVNWTGHGYYGAHDEVTATVGTSYTNMVTINGSGYINHAYVRNNTGGNRKVYGRIYVDGTLVRTVYTYWSSCPDDQGIFLWPVFIQGNTTTGSQTNSDVLLIGSGGLRFNTSFQIQAAFSSSGSGRVYYSYMRDD
jgi:hypothetical protein|tara:strand:+ start:478 stop:951 length:474 start_codon:yes stop_codon:yes gene_type:complete